MNLAEAEAPPSTGLIGGKYQLVKLIGRGGMGSVWEARHVSLGTPSAIKFIEAEYAHSTEARSRFDKEAKAAATIQSKHAIQIYDHGVTDDGKPYIVMELLTGEPLDKRIERFGQLSLQDTARIILQVSRGLARAHERGIVHRDLKPENIFIVRNTDDDEEIAKVLDFGIAKIQNSASSPGISSSTKTGAVLGTPFYMSPEQARGLRNVDHRTDIWSLGVIAFKCVTGRLPFDGESVGDLLVKICTSPVPVPSHAMPPLPPAFDAWFLHALEREPEQRFGSVTELADHLMFAAGLARGNTPLMSAPTPTLPAASGGYGPPGTDPQGVIASGQGYLSGTPHPAAMTAAPLTSSQSIPGVAASKWKWVVGAAAVGLAVAGIGTGVAIAMRRHAHTTSIAGIGVTQAANATEKAAPPASAEPPPPVLATTPPLEAPPEIPPDTKTVTAAKTTAAPPAKTSKPATKPGHHGPTGIPSAPPVTALPPPTTALPAPLPTPATTVKKTNKNDPGY